MTSTTSSNKNFFPLFKLALRRNRPLLIIYSIILLITGPVLDIYIKLRVSAENEDISFMLDIELVSSIIYIVTAAVVVLLSAVLTFSFLHNKRSVDMYGAFPSTRRTLFLSHISAGLLTSAVPYIIGMAAVVGITYTDSESIKFGAVMLIFTLLMITASYLFTALMAYCCGTSLNTVIATIAVNGIWVGAFAFFKLIMVSTIPGYSLDSILSTFADVALAPFGFVIVGIRSYLQGGFSAILAVGIVGSVIYIALAFVCCCFTANRRKAETAQDVFSFKWLPVVIESGLAVITGMIMGFMFAAGNGFGSTSMFTFSFWFIIGAAAVFCAAHISFNRGLKCRWGKSIIVCSAASAVCIAAVVSLSSGLGIDTYVPEAGSVSSATVYMNGVGITFKDTENVEAVVDIHKLFVDGLTANKPYLLGEEFFNSYDNVYYESSYTVSEEYDDVYDETEDTPITENDYAYDNSYVETYKLSYQTNLGMKVTREYQLTPYQFSSMIDVKKYTELVEKLFNSSELKKQSLLAVFDDKQRSKFESAEMSLTQHEQKYDENGQSEGYFVTRTADDIEFDKDMFNELCDALKKDIESDDNFIPADFGWRGYESNNFVDKYTMLRVWNGNSVYVSGIYSDLIDRPFGMDIDIWVIVKEDYTNTLNFLDKYNIKTKKYYNHTATYSEIEGGYEAMEKYIKTKATNDLKELVALYSDGWLEDCRKDFGIELDNKQFEDFTAKFEERLLEEENLMKENSNVFYPDGSSTVVIDEQMLCNMLDDLALFTQEYFIHLQGTANE